MTTINILPARPELGSLPYDLNEARNRLNNVMTEGEGRDLTDAVKTVVENECKRLNGLMANAYAMIDRIVGGSASPSDTPKNLSSLVNVINSGIDALSKVVGNGTVIDFVRNKGGEVLDGAQGIYDDTKKGIEKTADKISSASPFIILVLVLVLGIVFFAGRIGR